jgi:hypothetical protein
MTQSSIELFITIATFILVTVGIIVAIKDLKIIAKSHTLEVLDKFTNELKEHESARKYLFQSFKFESIDKVNEKSKTEVEKVINSLNRISVLLDNKLIASNIVFALCHTQIIRCEYLLKDYIEAKQTKMGGRYGQRIRKLANRAKKFQDSYKYHRNNPISLIRGKESFEIYRTDFGSSFYKRNKNKLEWTWRRMWKQF